MYRGFRDTIADSFKLDLDPNQHFHTQWQTLVVSRSPPQVCCIDKHITYYKDVPMLPSTHITTYTSVTRSKQTYPLPSEGRHHQKAEMGGFWDQWEGPTKYRIGCVSYVDDTARRSSFPDRRSVHIVSTKTFIGKQLKINTTFIFLKLITV